jgi:glutaminyl-peptide cyclotransferase
MRRAVCAFLLALTLAGCGGDEPGAPAQEAAAGAGGFDAQRAFRDLEAQVAIGPRPSESPAAHETAQLIADRLTDAGVGGVMIQRPYENVLATLPGKEPGVVVVGAHYDTKDIPGFVGANDGASGVAVVLELARTMPRPLAGPAVQFVLFDAEEARGERTFTNDGTRGSEQYVRYARKAEQRTFPLDQIRAMVLFDLVGDCDLEIPFEGDSYPELYRVFAVAAEQLNGDPAPFAGTQASVSDDHTPFLLEGIPAVDLIDFDFGPGPSPGAWWHSTEDTLDKVCPESLEAVGEPALRAIPTIR